MPAHTKSEKAKNRGVGKTVSTAAKTSKGAKGKKPRTFGKNVSKLARNR